MATKSKFRTPRKIKLANSKRKLIDFRDRHLTDMRRYFRYTNWADLWQRWYLSIGSDGRHQYKTIAKFAYDVAESEEQRSFLKWYLGPKPLDDEPDPDTAKYSFVPGGPVDWLTKRNEGGWYTPKNLEKFTAEIRRRDNVLEAMQQTGKDVTLHTIARFEQLAQKIDGYFKGEILLESLSLAENEARARLYIQLHQDIATLQERAFTLFAKSHGVNFDDMSGLVALYTATAMAAANKRSVEGTMSREEAAVTQLVRMTMAKAGTYKLPLPQEAESRIIDAVAESDARVVQKKPKLQ